MILQPVHLLADDPKLIPTLARAASPTHTIFLESMPPCFAETTEKNTCGRQQTYLAAAAV